MSTAKKTVATTKLVARKEPEATKAEATTTATATETKAPKAKKEKAPKEPKAPRAKKEKPVRQTPAHMAKVDKFAASLPKLSENAAAVFAQVEKLSSGELNVLAAHIALESRKRATAGASNVKLTAGDRVRIHSGNDTRYIGKEGTVSRVQRVRTFVTIPGFEKDAYVFTSNCEKLDVAQTIDISDDAPEATEKKTAVG